MSKDYYKILGVEKNSSAEDIKKAFRKLAHEHHPDKNSGQDAKFKEINEAYQVLGNKDKRAQYDQFGQTFEGAQGFGGSNPFGNNPFGGFQQGTADFDFDLGDIFGSFFGGGMGGRQTRTERGSDIEVDLEISLSEAVFGASKEISLRKQNKCQSCDGSGAKEGTAFETCSACNGRGRVTTTILGQFQTQTTCPHCRGKGKQIKEKCGQCGGDGLKTETEHIKVEIPAGINEGQSIRLSGKGNGGVRGASAGDLYIAVRIRPEAGFEREGDDLITKMEIPFSTAVLGGEVKVKTIDGQVKLKIPNGTPSGQQFILRNKGVNHLNSRGRGDQVVIVQVDVPTKLTKKQKQLIEELDKELKSSKKSWW